MNRISNVRIGMKLMIMSGLSILLVAGMIFSQLSGNAAVNDANATANLQTYIELRLMDAKAAVNGMQTGVRDIRLAKTRANLDAAIKYLEGHHQEGRRALDAVIPKARLPENRERMEKVRGLIDGYLAGGKEVAALKAKVIDLGEADPRTIDINDEAAKIAREKTLPLAAQLEELVIKAVAVAEEEVERQHALAEHQMKSVETVSIIVSAIVILVLIGTSIFGTMTIARPLVALTKPINELAGGNFDVQVDGVGRKDEVGQIATAVSVMAGKIRDTIGGIKLSAMEVNSASGEISTSTTDLSQRTEEQAASLEETTAAMEEISAAVKKSAENADQANRSAGQAREVADQGGDVVAKAVSAMARIEESSRKISDIIGVIDEIARQTNLLALNAAVEAARAGEAGRGFAVVATEVRGLAQRSSQAAKDIKELITNSNGQVQEGVELVNHAGEALAKIVESVKEVAALVSDIATASTEQATGLEQINRALAQMDEVTQQNAALVEENAATAKALESQAQSMDEQVAFFKIDGDARSVTKAKKPAESVAPDLDKAAPVAKKSSPKSEPVVALKRVGSGGSPARRMQTALATAVNADAEWKDF